MVFTEREHLNVFDNDQLVVIFMEDCTIDEISHIFFIAFGKEHQRLGITLGGLADPLPLRILADAFENSPDGTRQSFQPLFGFLRA